VFHLVNTLFLRLPSADRVEILTNLTEILLTVFQFDTLGDQHPQHDTHYSWNHDREQMNLLALLHHHQSAIDEWTRHALHKNETKQSGFTLFAGNGFLDVHLHRVHDASVECLTGEHECQKERAVEHKDE